MNHPYEERAQVEPFIGGASQGGFTEEETAGSGELYRYHAIHIIDTGSNKGKGRLALENDRVDGSFVSFDGGEAGSAMLIYSFRQKGMRFRSGITGTIPLGRKIVGTSRSGATPEFGYVKHYSVVVDISALTTAIINTIDGTATDSEANIFKARIAGAVSGALSNLIKARGIVRGPEGERHTTLATRPEADIIVEFGFE